MRRALSLLGIGLVIGLALAACGSDDASGKGNGKGKNDDRELEDVVAYDEDRVEVEVLDNSFTEENIKVKPGTTVVWTNNGRNDHDVIPIDGDEWGVEPSDFKAGDVYEFTFEKPGTYLYYCHLHGSEHAGMIGAVVVEE